MNYRTSIADALVNRIKSELDGSKPTEYYTNLYGNVSRTVFKFDEIKEFPYVSVHLGTETTDYLPSKQQWSYLNIAVLIYEKEKEDIGMQIEKLIADIKTVIDIGGNLEYTVTKPDGSIFVTSVADMTITSVDTDEGLLAPFGFAEINVILKYMPPMRGR